MTASVSLSQLVQVYFDQFEACSSIKSSGGQNCLNTFTVHGTVATRLANQIQEQ